MQQQKRVFITGYGALTATGQADETWNAILEGHHGLDTLKAWDISTWSHQLVGEIKNYKPADLLPDRKLMKVISKQDGMGIIAAVQAVKHSGIIPYRETLSSPDTFNEETAVYVGSPGNKYFQQYDFLSLLAKSRGDMSLFAKHLFEEVHPMWLLRILPNNVLAYTGITFGFKGPNHNITNHAVGGMQALLEAYHAIQSNQAKRAVVVSYDMGTEPQSIFYYEKLGVLSSRHLKPFDQEHDGTILAEGAAALMIESEESAKARGATIYAELVGGKAQTEGNGQFSLEENGEPLTQLIQQVLHEADVSAKDIGFVVAHGNGNKKSDISEACALTATLPNTPITAFKWSMGHTICASGVLDTLLASYAFKDNCIPGVGNFEKLAPSCAGLAIQSTHRGLDENKPYALVINRGFASMNACLLLKRVEACAI